MSAIDARQFEGLKKELEREKRARFTVVTGSMAPLIKAGDMIEVEPLAGSQPRRFDILVYWDGKILICHYVWHLQLAFQGAEQEFITRPLASTLDDLPVPSSRVLGRVISHKLSFFTKCKVVLAALLMKT